MDPAERHSRCGVRRHRASAVPDTAASDTQDGGRAPPPTSEAFTSTMFNGRCDMFNEPRPARPIPPEKAVPIIDVHDPPDPHDARQATTSYNADQTNQKDGFGDQASGFKAYHAAVPPTMEKQEY